MAKVTAVATVFPYAGRLKFLVSPKTQIHEPKHTIFPTKDARLLSKSAAFALWTWLPLWRVVFGLVAGKRPSYWARCPRRNVPCAKGSNFELGPGARMRFAHDRTARPLRRPCPARQREGLKGPSSGDLSHAPALGPPQLVGV